MGIKKWFLTVPMALVLLTGCSVTDFLVYKIDINQGNYVDQDDIEKLKTGMTQDQVRYVLGSPMLVEKGYPNTWYYIYYLEKGHKKPIQQNLILKFDDLGRLSKLSGDMLNNKS